MTTMQTVMTPEMQKILSNSMFKEPISYEERFKYAGAILTKVIANHSDCFKYFFFNDTEHFIEFAKWFDRKANEPFTDEEIMVLKMLKNSDNVIGMFFNLALFKKIAIGVFDKDELYSDLGVPKHARKNKFTPLNSSTKLPVTTSNDAP